MEIACLDLEGVLLPEIWVKFAEATNIPELKATTRDIPDYDELMTMRLSILDQHGLGVNEIQDVIATLSPLEGAPEFLNWLRSRFQVVILSDTFYQFAGPLMQQLGNPTLLCHNLEIGDAGRVTGYKIRQVDPKRKSVIALKSLTYRIIAAGDSYNDTSMLEEADAGILFCPPQNVIDEFPQYPVANSYDEFRAEFIRASSRELSL